MALVENFAAFMPDFGVDVTIGAETVRGIFDNGYAESFGVAGSDPHVLVSAAEVATAALGDPVTIGAANYAIVGIEPDGTGMTRLKLETA